MREQFARSVESLDGIFAYLERFATRYKLDQATAYAISLAVEEIITNMIKYEPEAGGEIFLDVGKRNRQVVVTITSVGVEPFDVTVPRDVDPDQSLQDRPIGKLGLHLVQQMMDDVAYLHNDGNSVITLTKNLEE
jgi:anti-sigma regulatory factor (Ser/Thr protein kinase)